MSLLFYYEPQEISDEKNQIKSSSFSIKQDLSVFLYPSNHSSAISEFEGMSLTIDYSVSSDALSSIVGVDESTNSYDELNRGKTTETVKQRQIKNITEIPFFIHSPPFFFSLFLL